MRFWARALPEDAILLARCLVFSKVRENGFHMSAQGTSRRRRYLFWAGAALMLTAIVVFASIGRRFGPFYRRDLQVHVTNAGQQALPAVTVYVTGNVYGLGELAAGQTASTVISPTSESHVEVGFESAPGIKVQLDAGGYFEPRYVGDISIRLEGGRIVDMQQNVFP